MAVIVAVTAHGVIGGEIDGQGDAHEKEGRREVKG
jgi:hypothetical protein